MRWQEKLTKHEFNHIKTTTIDGTLREFKRNRAAHLKEVASGKDDPCFVCRHIAIKLGVEGEGTTWQR